LGITRSPPPLSGFATTPFTRASLPEIDSAITHLHEVLGDEICESLARTGAHMTTAAAVQYALDHIDQVRAKLNVVS
jgi:hypothetical protein